MTAVSSLDVSSFSITSSSVSVSVVPLLSWFTPSDWSLEVCSVFPSVWLLSSSELSSHSTAGGRVKSCLCYFLCFLIILADLFIFLYYKQKTVNTVISQLIQLVFIKQFGSYYPIPAGRSQEFANVWYFNPWLGLRCCECSARCWGWPWPVTPCRAYCWCLSGLNGHEAALCPVTREVGGDQIERYLPHVWPHQSTGRLTEYNQHMELN